jgi:hypothetical protein
MTDLMGSLLFRFIRVRIATLQLCHPATLPPCNFATLQLRRNFDAESNRR